MNSREGVGETNSVVERQDRGRLEQTMGVGRTGGQERTHGVSMMDTDGKTGNLEFMFQTKKGKTRVC